LSEIKYQSWRVHAESSAEPGESMRNVNHCRQYATAMGLSLVLLVVGLWVAGMLADEVWAETEPELPTTTGEFPSLTISEDSALLHATAPLKGSLPPWPVSNEAFIPYPLCRRAHIPVSRAPPWCVVPSRLI
jgi:hypothetical protein